MQETEAQRRQRLAERCARINADDRYSPALKAHLVEVETEIAERDIAAIVAVKCERCGTIDGVTFAPCPYASDVNGDDTPVGLCDDCRHERAMDV